MQLADASCILFILFIHHIKPCFLELAFEVELNSFCC